MINCLIIGTGQIAKTHAESMKESNRINLVGFLGRNPESTSLLAKDFGVDGFTSLELAVEKHKIHMVILCTPSYIREEIIYSIIDRGIHILCEKPFALSYDKALKMYEYSKLKEVKLMVGHVVRFWPAYAKIKEMVDKKQIGDIVHVYCNRLSRHPDWSSWHKDAEKSGGGLYDLAIHDLDFLVHLLGEVKSVDAIGRKSDTDCYNCISANIIFNNKCQGTVESNMDMKGLYPFTTNIRLMGDMSTLEYISSKRPVAGKWEKYEYFILYAEGKDAIEIEIPKYDPYLLQMNYFADCILEDREPEFINTEEVLHVLKLIEKIEESIAKEMRIKL